MSLARISEVVYKKLYTSQNSAGTEFFGIICAEELSAMLEDPSGNFKLIDSRTPEEYNNCHIQGAVNIPEKKLDDSLDLLPSDRNSIILFYCNGLKCGKSSRSAKRAMELGYRNVMVFAEGMPVWEEKGYPFYKGQGYSKWIETTKIAPKDLWEIVSSNPDLVTVVDVCDQEEYKEEHIPGSINLPLASFASGSGIIDKNKRAVVYCKSGGRSYAAYKKLLALDYKDTYQLVLDDWKMAGLPVTGSFIAGQSPELRENVTEGISQLSDNKVSMSAVINAPIERVFDFIASPHNWPRYITGLRSIGHTTGKPLVAGDLFAWTYDIRGIEVRGTGQVTDLVANKKLGLRMHTLLPIHKTVFFEADSGKTILGVLVSYEAPGKVVSFLFGTITKMINKKESFIVLERIKALCEPVTADMANQPTGSAASVYTCNRPVYKGKVLSSALLSAFL